MKMVCLLQIRQVVIWAIIHLFDGDAQQSMQEDGENGLKWENRSTPVAAMAPSLPSFPSP
jgi:hypothetical protein